MGRARMFGPRRIDSVWWRRFPQLNWFIILCLVLIASIGGAMLYSVAGGSFSPWASIHMTRFGLLFFVMLIIAVTDIRVWMAMAYPAYLAGLLLLVFVDFFGATGMGGQRWLDFGFARVQPSELMKIGVVLAIARYFHSMGYDRAKNIKSIILPVLLLIIPFLLVFMQPDLGTALMIVVGGVGVIFLAGAPMWLFISSMVLSIIAIPFALTMLKDYQLSRITTFLNPENDPLGAGYQYIQSQIALGNGGLTGKGFLQGTQSHLNFLPEMKTDFIFTVLVEEFGLLGGLGLLLLYMIVLIYGLLVGLSCRNQFGRLLSAGLSITLFLYVVINIGMVMGLLPVVGVPLPMVSYGGSAMLTMMISFGLILSVSTNRHVTLAPGGSGLG